jgi:hypothetical protein
VSTQEVVTTGAALMGPVLSLVALWLQMRFQLRGERERRRYLLIVAMVLSAGSRIQETTAATEPTWLIVGATQRNEEQQ